MGRLAMKGVCEKGGRLYYRRKVKGQDVYTRLPALDDPTFAAAYQQARHGKPEREKPSAGTLGALVADFRASSAFRSIPSATTRKNVGRYLDMIATEDGHRTVRSARPSLVAKMRDRYQETPGKANNWLSVFKSLMDYAALNDWRSDNPAAPVKALPIGEHEPWPKDVLERALAAGTPMDRLLIVTGLCSGARVGDAIRMQHGWHDGRIMEFVTSKNGASVAVPMHPLWIEHLRLVPRSAVTILYDHTGKPYASTKTVQARVRRLMESIGAPTYISNGRARGYSFHGLRKNAACYLAELGLSDTEIGSICGMTAETVRHYTKRARAYMVARGAVERIVKGDVLAIKGGREQ
jgi:integrase